MESPARVLICYDGSEEAARAIDVAAALLVPTEAVVLAVAPALTVAESVATAAALPGPSTFHELHDAEATERARAGAERARRAGFRAEARGGVAGHASCPVLVVPPPAAERGVS